MMMPAGHRPSVNWRSATSASGNISISSNNELPSPVWCATDAWRGFPGADACVAPAARGQACAWIEGAFRAARGPASNRYWK